MIAITLASVVLGFVAIALTVSALDAVAYVARRVRER